MSAEREIRGRRWLAPEVVQTSAMDCGPATLKCLLDGYRAPASYGRLREACQTDIDGTSVDAIETLLNDIGAPAEQAMLPADYLLLENAVFPYILVVRQTEGPPHLVLVWRRVGRWLQVMDPAVGRRWVDQRKFMAEIFEHETQVAADDWFAWAAGEENRRALAARIAALGASPAQAEALIAKVEARNSWIALSGLDASIRLTRMMREGGAFGTSTNAPLAFLEHCLGEITTRPHDPFGTAPEHYWSAIPPSHGDSQTIRVRGAVLVRILGPVRVEAGRLDESLSPELVAALREKSPRPLEALWRLLKIDGMLAPVAMCAALGVAVAAVIAEALLFRGIFELGSFLHVGSQRLFAVLALLVFLGALFAFRLPIADESARLGRRLDVRLRMALLRKIPRLNDRYFQSRAVSDMAERAHNLHMLRGVPALAAQALQTICELVLTLIGLAIVDPSSALLCAAIVVAAVGVPLATQHLTNEADLRVRNHTTALNAIQLDALLGCAPVRVHRAQRPLRRVHESILVEWSRAARRQATLALAVDGVQQTLCLTLACVVIAFHFLKSSGVTGADLLFVFWVVKLPALGHGVYQLALAYPAQRNALLRLLEPMAAPEDPVPGPDVSARLPSGPINLRIVRGHVAASGQSILSDIDLTIRAGEHVAIVGRSGAGKSSLLGLLLGWHRLSEGEIEVNGRRLGAGELEQLRRRTAWVDPGLQLWNRTLLDNLTFSAPDADLSRVSSVIGAADLRHVLQSLPLGLQEAVGESGAAISGGEGQRLRLGRALMQASPDLVLLDEPFRGIDRGQRRRLLGEARSLWRSSTLICVSHDIAETQDFDRVILIERGKIVEDDRPARLAASNSRYRRMLDAEAEARMSIWTNAGAWRRVRVEDGRVAGAH
ncbi:MAG: ATP-binding cassette domain-containing protein [Beijerinckiaceae bacterium]